MFSNRGEIRACEYRVVSTGKSCQGGSSSIERYNFCYKMMKAFFVGRKISSILHTPTEQVTDISQIYENAIFTCSLWDAQCRYEVAS
jgi:hypothetical protein